MGKLTINGDVPVRFLYVYQAGYLSFSAHQVLIRNFVPAYVTRLETTTDVLKNQLAVNVARRHFQRIDGSWGANEEEVKWLLGVEKVDMTDDMYIYI